MKLLNKLKFLITVLVVSAMLFSAVGCGSPLYDDYVYVPPGSLPEKSADADYSPLKRYDQTVTVKVLGTDYQRIGNVPATYNGKPSGPSNNAFNDAALQFLNIKLQYVSIVSGESYEQRLQTMITAGEVPDIFITTDNTTFETLRRTGLIADIAPTFWYLNKEMQDFYLDGLYYPAVESCMQEGKLYAFPNVDNPMETAQKIYIRGDWLEIVNKEVPTTYEELIDVARAFKTNAAAIAAAESYVEAKDIVPIGMTKEIAVKGNSTAQGLFNILGVQPNAYFADENGEITDSNVSPEMKEALKELHSLYEEGLISKEFYTDTDASVTNDIIAGKVGIVSGMWHAATYPLQSSVNNENTPNASWISIELPPKSGVSSVPVVDTVRLSGYNMVSRSFKHPEALAKLINLFYDMFYSDDAQDKYGSLATPEGGFFYSWVPAKVWYTPYSIQSYYRINSVFGELYEAGYRIPDNKLAEMSEDNFDWKNYYTEMENGAYGSIFNKLIVRERDNGFKTGYPYMQAVKAGKKTSEMTKIEKSGYGIYEQTISDKGGYSYVAELSEGKKPSKRDIFYGIKTPAMQNYGEVMDTTMKQYFLGVITGKENINGWDRFVKNYNKNGGSAVLHQVKQWYGSANER